MPPIHAAPRPTHARTGNMIVARLVLLPLLAFTILLKPATAQGQGQPEPVPPPFNATVIRAFREKVLLNPPPVPDRSPYDPPQPPPPPPGWETSVCGVLYEDEDTRYRLQNYTDAEEARAAGAHVTHETPCGLCSSLEDLAVRGTATRPAYAAAGIGPSSLALPKYPPLRAVIAPEPETGGDSP